MLNKQVKTRIQKNRERRVARLRGSRLSRALDKARKPIAFATFAEEQLALVEKGAPVGDLIDQDINKRLTDVMANDIDERFGRPALGFTPYEKRIVELNGEKFPLNLYDEGADDAQ